MLALANEFGTPCNVAGLGDFTGPHSHPAKHGHGHHGIGAVYPLSWQQQVLNRVARDQRRGHAGIGDWLEGQKQAHAMGMKHAPGHGHHGIGALGITAAAQARQATAAQKKAARQAAAAQKKALRVAGKPVSVSAQDAAKTQALNASVASLVTEGKNNVTSILQTHAKLRAANLAAKTQRAASIAAVAHKAAAAAAAQHAAQLARARMPSVPLRGLGATLAPRPLPRAPVNRRPLLVFTQTPAQKVALAASKAAIARASTFSTKLRAAHGGIPAHVVTPTKIVTAAKTALRGFGALGTCMDDGSGAGTYIDDQTGQPCDPSQAYADPSMYAQPTDPSGGYYPAPYATQAPISPIQPLDTSLTQGFGMPFMQSALPQPNGCRSGSNAPRCLIFAMAQQNQQQMMFVFTIIQQMYGQLLQIVQQLMAEMQTAQQQPPPYYGPATSPYASPYGTPPYPGYDPNNPYGQQPPYPQDPYGYGGQYAGPGMPGSDSSMIPPGYDAGGGSPFDPGSGTIPGDISQVFPGPGPMQVGPQAAGPSAPNIISSDSLPDGSGPSTGGDASYGGGGDDAQLPAYTPAPPVAVAKTQPAPSQASQSVSLGPTQAFVTTPDDQGGQSPFPDLNLPAGNQQDQPSLEPPTEIASQESWAQGDDSDTGDL